MDRIDWIKSRFEVRHLLLSHVEVRFLSFCGCYVPLGRLYLRVEVWRRPTSVYIQLNPELWTFLVNTLGSSLLSPDISVLRGPGIAELDRLPGCYHIVELEVAVSRLHFESTLV